MSDTVATRPEEERLDPIRSIPFFAIHVVAFATPFVTGFSWTGVLLALGLYYLRMFGVTAGYHRYFAHRSYKTSRAFQFILALLGTTAVQKGVLWWAAHHRHHHKYSDTDLDVHSPRKGFWWSHMNWILCKKYDDTDFDKIRDFAEYPELRWLNRHFLVPPTALAVGLFLIGGWHIMLWGFFVSTVFLWHGTFTINSLAHLIGRRRYRTTDTSRNSMILALITCGEGWHNNHHHYQSTANQGWFWWEIDFSYYVLRALSWVRLVWDLRVPPPHIKSRDLVKKPASADAENEDDDAPSLAPGPSEPTVA